MTLWCVSSLGVGVRRSRHGAHDLFRKEAPQETQRRNGCLPYDSSESVNKTRDDPRDGTQHYGGRFGIRPHLRPHVLEMYV